MRLLVRAGPTIPAALALALAFACGTSSASKPASGLTGRVLVGPTCPVQRAGERCERPYRARVAVLRPPGDRRVETFRSGSDGRFRINLPPGRYVLAAAKAGLPRLTPLHVTVRAGRFTKLTLMFDTGIR